MFSLPTFPRRTVLEVPLTFYEINGKPGQCAIRDRKDLFELQQIQVRAYSESVQRENPLAGLSDHLMDYRFPTSHIPKFGNCFEDRTKMEVFNQHFPLDPS